MRMNQGRFRQLNSCGYVPRPKSQFIKNNVIYRDRCILLKIRVVGCCRLPKFRLYDGECNPALKVTVSDVVIDKQGARETTKSYTCRTEKDMRGNVLNPVWIDGDFFEFVIERKSVAMLNLSLYNDDDSLIGYSSIPISSLRIGFRNLKVYDSSNKMYGIHLFASIIVEIEIYDFEKYTSTRHHR